MRHMRLAHCYLLFLVTMGFVAVSHERIKRKPFLIHILINLLLKKSVAEKILKAYFPKRLKIFGRAKKLAWPLNLDYYRAWPIMGHSYLYL